MGLIERIKNIPAIKFVSRLPLVSKTYHFFLSLIGAWIYGFPGKKIYMIGVTGTKGKTTTLELLNSILEAAGEKTALISSVRVKIGSESAINDTGNTMPRRFYLARFLRNAIKAHCTVALIEVTSQGTELSYHRFMKWGMGIITNISPEHIEAHGSYEAYRYAKLKFLEYVLRKKGVVFINKEDPNSRFFIEVLKKRKIVVLYSREDAHIQSLLSRPSLFRKPEESPPDFILNDFNKDNLAAAETAARYIDIPENVIEDGVRNFRGVPGRMEFVQKGGITVVIDYAHTPESLEAVYETLKLMTNDQQLKTKSSRQSSVVSSKLICVLGSAGGGRDKWKRPAMGEIASRYCDEIILTNEDPYDEDPNLILSEIKSGIINDQFSPSTSSGQAISNVTEIPDRGEAINKAISFAKDGDVVVITGKGSELWIHGANGTKTPWNERRAVENALGIK